MPEVQTTWTPAPDLAAWQISGQGFSIRVIEVPGQFMVSGNLENAACKAKVDPQGAPALGLVTGNRYSVRLARDRMLVVSDEADGLTLGWHEEGYAVTSMMGALTVFEMIGPNVMNLVDRATTLSLSGESKSAAVGFAGVNGVLYRHRNDITLRFHVDCGLSAYICDWLEALHSCIGIVMTPSCRSIGV